MFLFFLATYLFFIWMLVTGNDDDWRGGV